MLGNDNYSRSSSSQCFSLTLIYECHYMRNLLQMVITNLCTTEINLCIIYAQWRLIYAQFKHNGDFVYHYGHHICDYLVNLSVSKVFQMSNIFNFEPEIY